MISEYVLGDCIINILDYRGKTPEKLGGTWTSNGVRVISALNVHDGIIDNEDKIRCVSEDIYIKWMSEEIQRYDCLLASEGASLGENTIWDSDERIVLGQRLYAIRTNPDVLDPWYFAMYMQTNLFQKQIHQVSTGSTVFGISQPILRSMKLLLPEINEQRKIGNLYKNIRNKLIVNKSMCSDLEALAKEIYDYWFLQFDFPDENGNPYKSSGGKMVWNENLKREIPDGWTVGKFGDICNFIMGQSPKGDSYNLNNNGLPLINGAVELTKEGIEISKYTTEFTRTSEINDWLFCIRATLGNINLSDRVYCLGRGVSAARARNSIFQEYIYFNLVDMIAHFEKSLSGSIIVGMTKDDIIDFPIVIPKADCVRKFHTKTVSLFERKYMSLSENRELTKLRDFLLPMLMNGQIKIGE